MTLGRPPIPADEQKASLLSVRFTAAERHSLERAAQRSERTVSEWARRTLLSAAVRSEPGRVLFWVQVRKLGEWVSLGGWPEEYEAKEYAKRLNGEWRIMQATLHGDFIE